MSPVYGNTLIALEVSVDLSAISLSIADIKSLQLTKVFITSPLGRVGFPVTALCSFSVALNLAVNEVPKVTSNATGLSTALA